MKSKLYVMIGAFLISGMAYAQTPATDWTASVKNIKTLVKTNPAQATQEANTLLKGKNKKNVQLILAVGRAFLEENNIQGAQTYLAMAQKVNNKDPQVSIFEGDIAYEQNDPGVATQKYEQAIYFDKNCFDAYLKYAKVYKGANPTEAINKLEDLKAVDPSQATNVDKTIAKIWYQKNQFQKAADAYAKFINTPAANEEDITRYATALLFAHQPEKSLEIAKLGLAKNPRSAVFNRISMYNYMDLAVKSTNKDDAQARWNDAEKSANALFNASDSATYSFHDYRYYGNIMNAQKKYKEAIDAFKNALKNAGDQDNKTRLALNKEISNAYGDMEDYPNAISYLKQYIDSVGTENLSDDDYISLGKLYDQLGVQTKNKAEYAAADSAFAKASELNPEGYRANLYRARTNSRMDENAEKGLAKPYYEKVAETLASKNDPRFNDILIEAYSYLGYYSFLKKQNTLSKEYWNKILAIDPANAIAKKALSSLK